MISILVSTCDSYHDVLDLFFYGIGEYWSNCPYKFYINGEKKAYDFNNFNNEIVTNISNEEKWGSRLLNTLDKIEDEFVITLLDDYILESEVNDDNLNYVISTIKNNSEISCIYLHYLDSFDFIDCGIPNLKEIAFGSLYKINTLPAIWRRKDLIAILDRDDDPWSWEAFSMYRPNAKNMKIMSVKSSFYNIYNYSSLTGGAIYRGKWVKKVVENKFIKYQISPEFSNREYLEENFSIKRSLFWKVNFIIKGFKISHFNVFYFIYKSFKSKWI